MWRRGALSVPIICLWMGVASVGSLAEQAPRSVLFLDESALILNPGYTEISSAFRDSLRSESVVALYDKKLNFITFRGLAYQSKLQAYIADNYADLAIGGVLTVGTSVRYGIQTRSGAWADVPVGFAAVDGESAAEIVKLRGTTGTNSGSGVRTENIKRDFQTIFHHETELDWTFNLQVQIQVQGRQTEPFSNENAGAEFHLALPSNNGGAV